MATKRLLTIFVLMLVWLSSWGQSYRLFTGDDNLSSTQINNIYCDRAGMIWVATEYALNRYDGNQFKAYYSNPYDSHSISDNYITCFVEDRNGRLFVGTHSGVQYYDPASDSFSAPARNGEGTIYKGHIRKMILMKDGRILAVGDDVLIITGEGDNLKVERPDLPLPPGYIENVIQDREGSLWYVIEKTGIVRLKPDGTYRTYLPDGDYNIYDIIEDRQHVVYVADVYNGLLRYDPADDRFERVDEKGKQVPVRCIYQLSDNDMFLGTDGEWIKVYHPQTNTFTDFGIDGSLDYRKYSVHGITRDKAGNIWAAVFQKGVMMAPLNGGKFSYIGPNSVKTNYIGSGNVTSLYRDREGTMWVGTISDGIYGLGPDNFPKYHYDVSRNGNSIPVTSFFEDSEGNFWFGTSTNGAGWMDRHTGRFHYLDMRSKEGFYVPEVSGFTEDGEKHVWIATMGYGVFRYDLRTGEITDARNLVRDLPSYITSIRYSSRVDNLYLGTFRGPAYMDLDKDFMLEKVQTDNIVHTIFETAQGEMWFGCDDGVIKWSSDENNVQRFSSEQGLPSDVVYGIQRDNSGNMWFATIKGLSRYNPSLGTFINFLAEDGIQGNEFSKNASWKDVDGTIWFGGVNGITYFHPQAVSDPSRMWDLWVTGIYIHNAPVVKGQKSGRYEIIDAPVYEAKDVRLCYRDNAFTVLFAPKAYNAPKRLRFEYRVNGGEWDPTPSGNRVSFSSMKPGNYFLELRAVDNQTFSSITSLTFHIAKAWWNTWWARILELLFVAAVVTLIYRLRRKARLAREEIANMAVEEEAKETKLKIFTDISHDLRSPLTLIMNPLKRLMAEDKNPDHQRSYRTMHRNADRILQLVNQLMDVRKLDNGQLKMHFSETEMVSYLGGIAENFQDQFAAGKISFRFQHDGLERYMLWIDRLNFDKVIFNLLTNAIKYVPEGGNIDMSLSSVETAEGKKLARISIMDDGIGVRPEDKERIFDRFYQTGEGQKVFHGGNGIGLHLAKSIVQLHHGDIHVEDNPLGKGSSFIIRLPEGFAHLSEEEMKQDEEETGITYSIPAAVPDFKEETEDISSKTRFITYVVDDDKEISEYISDEMAADYHICTYENGRKAMDAIFVRQPDLVISDVSMPEMDGFTLCGQIKQNINLNHIPVILLTARIDAQDNIAGLKTGADAYIKKPFDIGVLKTTVSNLLETRKVLRNKFSGNQIHNDKLDKPEVQTPDDNLMARIMRVLNENISNSEFTVEKLASEVGISRVHIYRKLKELTNQSASDFIRNTRLSMAATLLSEGKQSVSDIARQVGFENPDYFATAFKKLYGKTPREYMKENSTK